MVAVDLISLTTILGALYTPETFIEILIQSHRDAHGIAAQQRQAFPEYQNVNLFRVAIKPCGLYDACVLVWLLFNATVATQSFDSLSTAILSFSDNFDQTATASSLEYAATAQPTSLFLQNMIAAAVSVALLNQHPKPHIIRNGTKYCWSHGTQGSHNS